jgi:hypothetical protein
MTELELLEKLVRKFGYHAPTNQFTWQEVASYILSNFIAKEDVERDYVKKDWFDSDSYINHIQQELGLFEPSARQVFHEIQRLKDIEKAYTEMIAPSPSDFDKPKERPSYATYVHTNNGYDCDRDLAKKYLKVGASYEILQKVVHSFRTEIFLKNFPDVGFNSVLFDIVEAEYDCPNFENKPQDKCEMEIDNDNLVKYPISPLPPEVEPPKLPRVLDTKHCLSGYNYAYKINEIITYLSWLTKEVGR